MESGTLYYASGEEVHIGDRVQYRGVYATVVVVSNGESYEMAPGYEGESGIDRGVMICDDDGALNSLSDGNDQLVFMDRG